MSKFVLLDARIFASGADLTTRSSKVELSAEIEEKETTAFGGNGWREILGGIGSATLDGEGQWEAGDPSKVDDEIWGSFGKVVPWTLGPDGAAVEDIAWMLRALDCSYTVGGAVGDVVPWTAKGASSWPLVRGLIAHPPGTARTVTGNGVAIQRGAVPSGRHLYASLHVLSVSGTGSPSITVKVQSDDNAGFTTATDRITFNAATARGGQIARLAGPLTDDYYRAQWTVAGTAPSFLFVVAIGAA